MHRFSKNIVLFLFAFVTGADGILTADIAGAYDSADCKSFVRTIRMKPGKVGKDDCKLYFINHEH